MDKITFGDTLSGRTQGDRARPPIQWRCTVSRIDPQPPIEPSVVYDADGLRVYPPNARLRLRLGCHVSDEVQFYEIWRRFDEQGYAIDFKPEVLGVDERPFGWLLEERRKELLQEGYEPDEVLEMLPDGRPFEWGILEQVAIVDEDDPMRPFVPFLYAIGWGCGAYLCWAAPDASVHVVSSLGLGGFPTPVHDPEIGWYCDVDTDEEGWALVNDDPTLGPEAIDVLVEAMRPDPPSES